MLLNSFIHLPGIGAETERRLWQQGLKNWDDLESQATNFFGAKKAQKIMTAMETCRVAYQERRFEYFQSLFKGADIWRLVPALIDHQLENEIAYLDIETTGLGFPPESHSTTVAVLFRGQLEVEHEPLRKRTLLERVESEAKLIVTFNGGPFDLPFLRREFDLAFRQPHLDLRFWLARHGYRGGLKKIQTQFADVPQRDCMDIDGFDAVRLWSMHLRGVPRALETLMTYNAEDTVVLEQLIYCGLELESKFQSHVELQPFRRPSPTPVTTTICPDVYRMLRGR